MALKRLTLVVLSGWVCGEKAVGALLRTLWTQRKDGVSAAVQNATDRVTEPVNIADGRDLHRSLGAPLAFCFALKGQPAPSALGARLNGC